MARSYRHLQTGPDSFLAATRGSSSDFASFDLQIAYEKAEGRVELSATVSEAVAEAFQNAETLLAEGSSVLVTNIAGARFVSQGDARIIDPYRLAGVALGRSSSQRATDDDEPVSTTNSDHARSR